MIHLARTQNVSKNWYFLPPDTHTYVCVLGGKKNSEKIAFVLNE